jgi:predicted TIM-barrel fold metal-dependent hydrolase
MRTVALEEHFAAPALSARIAKDIISRRGYRPRTLSPGVPNPLELLPEIGEIRLKSMDETGTAVELDVPIYIHPHIPPEPVRRAYFSGLPDGPDRVLETAGWGWHSETAVHLLRMVIAGTLDRHPRLRLIVGHMGEMLPMMMARIDQVFKHDIGHLKRPITRAILDQVWLTTSGIFDEPPFLTALLTFGIDRIMFSVDYPYAPNAAGRKFLDRIALAPDDRAKLTHATADRLLKLRAPAAATERSRTAAASHA